MAGLGLVNAGGARAAVDELHQMLAERYAMKLAADARARQAQLDDFNQAVKVHEAGIADQELGIKRGSLDVDRAKLGIEGGKLDLEREKVKLPDVSVLDNMLGQGGVGTFSVGVDKKTGRRIWEQPAAPKPKSYQDVDVMVDGRRQTANYDPSTGKFFDQATNAELKGAQKAPPLRDPNATAASDTARVDRSYNQANTELLALRKPAADHADKIDELNALLDAHSPEADALIAPKLLTALVGGQGTGVRITQGEINTVLHGRSRWEDFSAFLNSWKANPDAVKITESQRQQIRDVVNAVGKKVVARLDLVDQAGRALVDANDVQSHRNILMGVRERLSKDAAAGGRDSMSAPEPVVAPAASWHWDQSLNGGRGGLAPKTAGRGGQ